MKNSYGVLAALCGLVAIAAQFLFGAGSSILAANTYDAAVDTHCESIIRTNDAAIATRHLLYKEGSSPGTGAALCGAGDLPLGTIDNIESSTGIAQNVLLLGKEKTVKMVASEAISIGDWLYTAASGKVQNEPGSAGTYYRVGRALTAAGADGNVIEVESHMPQLTKVIANASTLGQTQAAMVGGAIVIVLGA
jgi:hypothetical protein